MELNFGKYKGYYVEDIPTSYLAYLLDADFVNYELKAACLDEIIHRYSDYEMSKRSMDRTVIDNTFRKLSMKHHPDKGGNHQAMIAINEFRKLLLESI